MKRNSRVLVAFHSLIHLHSVDSPLTSKALGECQSTNPVIIRRVLGELKKAGIVSSEKGHGGGWVILKHPDEITFQDVFSALGESLLPPPIVLADDEHCLVMKLVASAMDAFLVDAEKLLSQNLSSMSLDDITQQIDVSNGT